MDKRNKKKGFTLIEMIVVVAIIAILVGIGVPQITKTIANTKKKTDIANAKTIAAMLQQKIAEESLTTKTSYSVLPSDLDNVPTVKYNTSWKFVYKYDGIDNLEIAIQQAADVNYIVYPSVSDNACKDDGTTLTQKNPYK